jgi:uncharacterized phage-like protein YoqJ
MKEYTIAVTGHRPNKLWGYDMSQIPYDLLREAIGNILVDTMLKEFREHRLCRFRLINGMALGVDQIFCEESIYLRDKRARYFNPFVRIVVEAAVPCFGHASKWPKKSQDAYERLIYQCDDVTIVTKAPYSPAVMQKRNEYMVDKADVLIAVWNGKSGGTANCVKYAQKKDVKIIRLDPDEI